MDIQSILIECTIFTAEVCLTCIFYYQYEKYAKCLKSLKEAQCLELNDELKKNIEKNNGEIGYGAICGKVQALTSPLYSHYIPLLTGVIREKITLERKVKWNPVLKTWGSSDNDLIKIVNSVPFAVCGSSGSFFKKSVCVEVLEPSSAKELLIPTVHNEFKCHHDSIGDAVFSVVQGEKILGTHEIEKLLCVNDTLTAVGKLVIENNKITIKPPDEGLTYFLTPLSLESLINKINVSTEVYKVSSIIMGTLTFVMFLYFSRRAFLVIKRKVTHRRERKRLEEQRKLRRMADKSRKQQNATIPKCAVCLENPIEILILECGHACLCYNCGEIITDFCPVCRNRIERKVSAFWP